LAPHDTNIEKQKRRHGPPLIILAVVVALVFAGFIWWVGIATDGDEVPAYDVPAETAAPPE